MYQVVCDKNQILERAGMDVVKQTITGCLFRDCRLKTFMVFDEKREAFLVADNMDRGDFEFGGKNFKKMRFVSTFFTYEGVNGTRKADEYSCIVEAFRDTVPEGAVLLLPGDMAMDSFYDLQEAFTVKEDFSRFSSKRYIVYQRSKEEVLNQIHEGDAQIDDVALAFFENRETAASLEPYARDHTDTRFEKLDKLLAENGCGGILLSSPMNVQELAGLPFLEIEENECYVAYCRGAEQLFIIAERPLTLLKTQPVGSNVGLREAVEFAGEVCRWAVEEAHLPISRSKEIGLDKTNTAGLSWNLRLWREERSCESLSYNIVAARLTAFCVDGARSWAEDMYCNDCRFTEKEVFAEYCRLRHVFIKKYNLPIQVSNYDASTYSSDRTDYCSVDWHYLIPKSAGSLRIDNGEFIMDKYGYIQATSDIARTACFSLPSRRMQQILFPVMREEIINKIRPGMSFGEIWEMGADAMAKHQEKFKELGMIPENVDFKMFYDRNIGHGMSKQTRTANFIVKANERILPAKFVGNIELPFNYRNDMVAVEDTWFVTEERAYNITVG